jgi:hypothetical protein
VDVWEQCGRFLSHTCSCVDMNTSLSFQSSNHFTRHCLCTTAVTIVLPEQ